MPFSPDLVEVLGRQSAVRLDAQAARWSKRWGIPALTRDVTVVLNPRLRTTVARYKKERELVELGPRFLALRSRKAEVLAHELAHVAVARLFGKAPRPHGEEWRNLVRAAGFTPHIHLVEPKPVAAAPGRQEPGRVGHYEHRCPVCQMVRIGRRSVPRWKCRRCVSVGLAGTLVVTRILPKK